MKLDRKYCHVPESPAYILGVLACICLLALQIVGNVVIAISYFSQTNKTFGRGHRISFTLVVLSWYVIIPILKICFGMNSNMVSEKLFWLSCRITFGSAITLMGLATSMNGLQSYGKGWLDGECYIVKDGVYIGVAGLIFTTVTFLLGSILVLSRLSRQKIEKEAETYGAVLK